CTFSVAMCLNNSDTRLPTCAPTSVATLNPTKPRLAADGSPPADPTDAVNVAEVMAAAASLGATLLRDSVILAPGTTVTQLGRCSGFFPFRVPLLGREEAKRVLSIRAKDGPGTRTDSDRLNFICVKNSAVCGNSSRELGEQCDDGNRSDGDGCSSICGSEVCGNARRDFAEQCDDGNGVAGDGCSSLCRDEPPGADRINWGLTRRDCLLSEAVDNPNAAGGGRLSRRQICRNGDPTCDFGSDPTACLFHVWVCMNEAKPECGGTSPLVSAETRRPSPSNALYSPLDRALRETLQTGYSDLDLPSAGEAACSGRLDLALPLKFSSSGEARRGVKSLTLRGVGAEGLHTDTDTMKFECLP
ncbi:MAG: hypothetical protein ACRD1Z_22870, partial [Vicinamibacteria bacterium]